MSGLHDEINERLATGMAQEFDATLREAITARLGEGWQLEELRGRLTRLSYEDEVFEDWTLDGQPLLRAWPIEVVHEGTKIKVRRNVAVARVAS